MRVDITNIVGGRQSGRTQKLIELAFDAALDGHLVHFWSHRTVNMADTFRRCQEMAQNPSWSHYVEKVYLANRDEQIRFTTGGRIVFKASQRNDRTSGTPGVQVLDDIDEEDELATLLAVNAPRVIRSVLE